MSELFPPDFAQRMKETLAGDWEEFVSVHATTSPVSVRLNPKKETATEWNIRVPWAGMGRYLPARPVFTLDPVFHGGAYYVQEASSMFLEQVFVQHIEDRNIRVLDLCAAPGGKSTHLLSLLGPDALLVSNEVIRTRVNTLTENIIKWGYPNVVVTNNDSADFSDLTGLFDVIVVDAPCSGEGMFRKDPDAMQEWSTGNVQLCSARQRRILYEVWPALKPGGILIYSTCTYAPEENELNLKSFSEEHDVEFIPLSTPAEWNIETITTQNVIGYRFFPHRTAGEGFFMSVLKKKGDENQINTRLRKDGFTPASSRIVQEVKPWLIEAPVRFIQRGETIQLLPAAHHDFISFLSHHLRINYAGTFIALQKQNKLIPEHAAALSTLLNRTHFPIADLPTDDALQYLRRETLMTIIPQQKGFTLASCKGIPLGWMNVLQGRINNLYPSEWRIRMKA